MSEIKASSPTITVYPGDGAYPPLMFVGRQPIPDAALERIGQIVQEGYAQGLPFVVDCPYMDVYQLIDGQWCLLESRVDRE